MSIVPDEEGYYDLDCEYRIERSPDAPIDPIDLIERDGKTLYDMPFFRSVAEHMTEHGEKVGGTVQRVEVRVTWRRHVSTLESAEEKRRPR